MTLKLRAPWLRNLAISIDSTKFPWIGESPYEIAQSICILFRKYRSREEFISLVTYIDERLEVNGISVNPDTGEVIDRTAEGYVEE